MSPGIVQQALRSRQEKAELSKDIFSTTFIHGYFRSESKDREREVALLFW